VEHIVKVASILSQPFLEQETIEAINAYIRDGLKQPEAKPSMRREDIQSLINEYVNGVGPIE
jgi:hypothetical protein